MTEIKVERREPARPSRPIWPWLLLILLVPLVLFALRGRRHDDTAVVRDTTSPAVTTSGGDIAPAPSTPAPNALPRTPAAQSGASNASSAAKRPSRKPVPTGATPADSAVTDTVTPQPPPPDTTRSAPRAR